MHHTRPSRPHPTRSRSRLLGGPLGPFVFAAALSGCGSDLGGETSFMSPGITPAPGLMELRLVDAPTREVTEIVVTITKVTAHVAGGGGWVTLAEQTATVDLLKLQGGTFAQLGVTQVPSGRITQFRLYVLESGPNYVTTPDGVHHPLTVPSGPQSGIKIKGGFDWAACANGNVTLDFDGKKSIFVHPKGAGAGDEWLLRPVVRLKSVSVDSSGCENPGAPPAPTPPAVNEDPEPPAPPAQDPPAPPAPPTPPQDPPAPPAPPVMTTPPGDPCANVTCEGDLYCWNGVCTAPID